MKNLDKVLSRTLLTYGFVLIFVFILKLFGLDYFGLNTNNEVINKINDFILHWKLENVWYAFTLYINGYVIMSITCNDNSKKMKKFVLCCLPLFVGFQYLKTTYNAPFLFIIIDLLYLFILSICYIKFINKDKLYKHNVGNYWLLVLCMNLFQILSISTRNISITNENNFLIYMILDIDYIMLMLLTKHLYFIKGGKSLWVEVHSSFSDLLTSLKSLPVKLRQSYQDAKPKTHEDALADKIYLFLFWLYNFFTVAVVLFIATLNDTFIECIFILTSFWMNKGAFGKAFHLKKASTCFVVSTLSYYVLNRLTWDIGLSFLIPLSLGITLSYVTSLFMTKYEVTHLYQGMPEEDFYMLISKVTDNKEHIEICKKFYVNKYSNVKLSYEFNYSVPNIKKIKQKINMKIKELQ